jgi:hypothetical protein
MGLLLGGRYQQEGKGRRKKVNVIEVLYMHVGT